MSTFESLVQEKWHFWFRLMQSKRSIPSRELTPATKQLLLLKLCQISVNDKIPRGCLSELAIEFNCSPRTVHRVWKKRFTGNVETLRKGRCGRKVRFSEEEVNNRIAAVPLSQRQTLRDTGEATGIAKSTLARYLKSNVFKRTNTTLRPLLTDANKIRRLEFCLQFLNPQTGRFKPMNNIIHIDEKWFNMEKNRRKFYLAKHESPFSARWSQRSGFPNLCSYLRSRDLATIQATESFTTGKLVFGPLQ